MCVFCVCVCVLTTCFLCHSFLTCIDSDLDQMWKIFPLNSLLTGSRFLKHCIGKGSIGKKHHAHLVMSVFDADYDTFMRMRPSALLLSDFRCVCIYMQRACRHTQSRQSCPTLCSPPGSSVHGILKGRIHICLGFSLPKQILICIRNLRHHRYCKHRRLEYT